MSEHFSFAPDQITLKQSDLESIQEKVTAFNKLHDTQSLIRFTNGNNQDYRQMLYSESDLIGYHEINS